MQNGIVPSGRPSRKKYWNVGADTLYFTINDANYWYEIHGKGAPVVLFHGFTGSSGTWSHLIEAGKDQLQFITIDLPGHGKTKMSNPRTMEACCKDISHLLDTLGYETVHVVGYSMGGRTALSFAMAFPERIRSLTLESASPGLEVEETREKRAVNDEELAKRIERNGIREFVHFWENIPLFESQKDLPAAIQQKIRKERLEQSESGLAMSLRYMGTGSQPSWWSMLHTFEKPVQLLVGERDEKFVSINKKMQSFFFSCKLIEVEDAGHAIHVEKPDVFDKLVIDYIKLQEQLHKEK
ncbi:2-succinyl-6-hydroxy-2,4-cyclohexadiene-1-carboxylate synthase [Oceanobacillus piezotolerans]|uniref:Putative 2-succinyl-6-hydroxy-2,4-cyclohexadiene-1-carboxylate synthase n=2 Tax=Oceanobacillus piezotolerans TaxID=2448030 RepID=A0A498DJ63_9BACI|nr:2-succinyl-6-hydroxy-2,4-cyclohexadiene-1-carboxylate synthase [Oceanobacillus piezotolerans]